MIECSYLHSTLADLGTRRSKVNSNDNDLLCRSTSEALTRPAMATTRANEAPTGLVQGSRSRAVSPFRFETRHSSDE